MTATRRSFLLGATAAGAVVLTGCADDESSGAASQASPSTENGIDVSPTYTPSTPEGAPTPRVLLAYFSRPGENYYYGDRIDLEVGNTAVLAEMIAARVACDRYEIVASDPYPDDYDETVERNRDEQDDDARPAIANDLPDVAGYDVVVLASPVWNVRPPMIMSTFAEALDLRGTTVHPVVTYAVSGLGPAPEIYADACPGAEIGEALAVQGEEVDAAGADVDDWLASSGLT